MKNINIKRIRLKLYHKKIKDLKNKHNLIKF